MRKGQGLLFVGLFFIIAFALIDIALTYDFSNNERLAIFLLVLLTLIGGIGVYAKTTN
jgi:hypothetical protein